MWIAIASSLLTLCAVFVVLNLATGEKKIEQRLERLYATDEPQFRRAMGNLLGPPIVDGNKTEVLLNGDMIFAAMLSAIKQARRTITFETYIYWSRPCANAAPARQ
jgi:cardiolipin synthase